MKKTIEEILQFKVFCDLKEEEISDQSKKELLKVYEFCLKNKWKFHTFRILLRKMLFYNVPPDWCERIRQSKEKFKQDTSSLESYENRYGKDIGKKLWEEKTNKTTVTKEKYIKKYGEEAWIKLCQSKSSIDLNSFIKRYGEKKGKKKREEYLKKWRKTIKEKGGWDNGISLDAFIRKFGEKEGYRKWNEKRKKQSYRFSIEWYIEKYGTRKGKKEWKKYCDRMAKLSSIGFQSGKRKNYSDISQRLFNDILKQSNIKKEECYYYENNGEKKFNVEEDWGHYLCVDFLYKNKIIEFDGKYWHSKKEIIDRDKKKDILLKKKGYDVKRIKERDYKANPLKILEECINFVEERKDEKK